MKLIYCVMLLLCPYAIKAQPKLYALSPGERMPNLSIRQVLNYTDSSINLSSIKGKLLILDFMYSTCGSCIRSLAAMDILQERFADRIQLIAVSPQKKSILQQFLKKNALGCQLKMPFVAEDSLLKSLFPHEFVSHIAWIGADGIVKAITGADYVNAANIQALLDGENINWPVKKDEPDFDYQQPLSGSSPHLQALGQWPLFSSALFNYMPGIRPYAGNSYDSVTQLHRYLYFNMSLPHMLKALYGKWHISNSRIVLSEADSALFQFNAESMYRHEWNERNLFCYEAFIKKSGDAFIDTAVIAADIAARFNVRASFQQMPVLCLLLRKLSEPGANFKKSENSVTLWHAIEALNSLYNRQPVINSIKGTQNIALPLDKAELTSPQIIRAAINKAGYELHPEKRMMEMLVIESIN